VSVANPESAFPSPNLLADELGSASFILPLAEEKLSQEWVQWLLLISILLTTAGVLLFECGQEPLQHEQGSLLGVRFLSRGGEDGGMLAPVRREFCQAGRGEDEGRCGKAGEVTVEGGYGLRNVYAISGR